MIEAKLTRVEFTVRTRGGVGSTCYTLAEVVAAYRHYSQCHGYYAPVITGSDGVEYELFTNPESGFKQLRVRSQPSAAAYKTAFSKTWGVFVRLDSVSTEDGVSVFACSGTDRNGDKFSNWLFTERELSDFCF